MHSISPLNIIMKIHTTIQRRPRFSRFSHPLMFEIQYLPNQAKPRLQTSYTHVIPHKVAFHKISFPKSSPISVNTMETKVQNLPFFPETRLSSPISVNAMETKVQNLPFFPETRLPPGGWEGALGAESPFPASRGRSGLGLDGP
ncbi:hypothetical protein KC19_5G033300 [Ceratodon purpureus]|uniref:Uncharacterized protein n=1 Tax=Ceratodon purpureus TaxID=3225 RepID=A0A8T0HYU0_CERPU|nr:hypothetical protein KC19_5G033300 [Ceratodon purpureus]